MSVNHNIKVLNQINTYIITMMHTLTNLLCKLFTAICLHKRMVVIEGVTI